MNKIGAYFRGFFQRADRESKLAYMAPVATVYYDCIGNGDYIHCAGDGHCFRKCTEFVYNQLF